MNDTALNNATLELTQKIQLHFPRDLDPAVVQFWNGQPKESISARLLETFGRIPEAPTSADVPQQEPKSLPMSITINADGTPFIPSGLSLQGKGAEHRGMGTVTLEKRADGQLYINGQKVERYLSPNQRDGNVIGGYDLAKELKDEPTPNACILDALYENQQLIPDGWENGLTYFWATKFRCADGRVCVGCLYRLGGRWGRDSYWLDDVWYDDEPAARLAKNQDSAA